MGKIIIQVTPRLVVHVDDVNVKNLVEQAAFWSMLPSKCPVCNSEVVFTYRHPQDYEYYGMQCNGIERHEVTFGEYKDQAKGLYYKPNEPWRAWGAGQQQQGDGQQQYAGQGGPDPDSGQQGQYNNQYATPIPSDPIAKSLSELVTTKQLGMIRAVERELNLNADLMCLELMKCNVSELSRRAASALIDKMQNKPEAPETPQAQHQQQMAGAVEQPTLRQAPPAADEEVVL